MRSVFTIYGCYIQFQFMLLTVLGYFQEIYENHPSGNTPLFENVPQDHSRFWNDSPAKCTLSLTGNKRPPPQQKGDAKQGSILDYYNWPGWPALNKSRGSGHLTLWLLISFMVRLPLSNANMQILHTVTFRTFFKGYGYTLPFAAFLTMDIWNTAKKKGK